MFYEVSFSSQVKLNLILSNKHGMYEFPHELRN